MGECPNDHKVKEGYKKETLVLFDYFWLVRSNACNNATDFLALSTVICIIRTHSYGQFCRLEMSQWFVELFIVYNLIGPQSKYKASNFGSRRG